LLAGGQNILTTLNMRLSEPELLIDLQSVQELKGITLSDTTISIGAMVTHDEVAQSAIVTQHAPLLTDAAPHIAHQAIRNLGTFGGSIAYGDPAAEWPACLLALNGEVVAVSVRGTRRIAAADFFTGLYSTALQADELILACEIPTASAQLWTSFQELARRHGDYAVVGLAAAARTHQTALQEVRLAWIGAGDQPLRSTATEQVLESAPLSEPLIAKAIACLKTELAPRADMTHSTPAKLHLAAVLLQRALNGLLASTSISQMARNT
jgi:carbon-monoxide dehydrogenase medium subunit